MSIEDQILKQIANKLKDSYLNVEDREDVNKIKEFEELVSNIWKFQGSKTSELFIPLDSTGITKIQPSSIGNFIFNKKMYDKFKELQEKRNTKD